MIAAGLAYFAVVFAVGFLLAAVRILVILPMTGELAAVLLELPIILTVSWLAAGRLIERFDLAPRLLPHAAMGASAFAWLMLAELGLALLAFDLSPSDYLHSYGELPVLIGLAGQIVFAVIPVVRLLFRSGRRRGE